MPTRQGWTTLAASVAALVIGRVFGILELYVVAAGLLAAMAIALGAIHLRGRPRLRTTRRVRPDVVRAGEDADVQLRVANRGRTTTPPVQLWEPVGALGGAAMRLAPLHPREESAASYRLPATRRGVLAVGPLVVTRRDVFGLAQTSCVAAPRAEVTVVPWYRTVAVPTGAGGTGAIAEVVRLRAMGAAAGEFRGLRDYVAGDDLRRVHWKASARSDGLKVREVDASGIRRCTVVLDRSADQYDADGFERAVSIVASIVTSAAMSMPARLWAGPGVDVRGPAAGAEALRALAATEPLAGDGLAGLAMPATDGLGLVVVVTGNAAGAAPARVRSASGPGEIVAVVACTVAPREGLRLTVDATTWDRFAEGWRALAGSPDVTAGWRAPRAAVGAPP